MYLLLMADWFFLGSSSGHGKMVDWLHEQWKNLVELVEKVEL